MNSSYGPILNAYPDSMGGRLEDIVRLLKKPELTNIFSGFYILPSLFNSDLDRGFSIIDYSLNESYASADDIEELRRMGIALTLDFVLNHASVLSPQFQDLLQNGLNSAYADFFIHWNTFWANHGKMTPEGYIQPDAEVIENMFFRKPGLPLLMVRMANGEEAPFWNTFYQEVIYPRPDAQDIMRATRLQYTAAHRLAQRIGRDLDAGIAPNALDFSGFEASRDILVEWLESRRKYLGQMDLNIQSPMVWAYYQDTLKMLADYGASIVRLDAFAYAPKEPGGRNFLNDPGTWELLDKVREIADPYALTLLPEIHANYAEKTYEKLAEKGYAVYDFFLPGLLIDAIERKTGAMIARWANEILEKKISAVNMLGCHDGIPLLDLEGLIPKEQIQYLVDAIVRRGGHVKNLHGQKNMYYQVNATYFSALGEDDRKMLLARAVQLFMPGRPQIWYLDLFAGKNDHAAVQRAGANGHREINRSNLSLAEVEKALENPLVQGQLSMLRFRNAFPAFHPNAQIAVEETGASQIRFIWSYADHRATLDADFAACTFFMQGKDADGKIHDVLS